MMALPASKHHGPSGCLRGFREPPAVAAWASALGAPPASRVIFERALSRGVNRTFWGQEAAVQLLKAAPLLRRARSCGTLPTASTAPALHSELWPRYMVGSSSPRSQQLDPESRGASQLRVTSGKPARYLSPVAASRAAQS